MVSLGSQSLIILISSTLLISRGIPVLVQLQKVRPEYFVVVVDRFQCKDYCYTRHPLSCNISTSHTGSDLVKVQATIFCLLLY
jgi:hypothetical protein